VTAIGGSVAAIGSVNKGKRSEIALSTISSNSHQKAMNYHLSLNSGTEDSVNRPFHHADLSSCRDHRLSKRIRHSATINQLAVLFPWSHIRHLI
jgi:hypothetical protein